jgi:hypothetical protein
VNPLHPIPPLRLRWTLGHVDLPAVRHAPVKGANRLVALGSMMVVSCGLLMALDAPRTLGLFLSLLLGVEVLVLAGAAVGQRWNKREAHGRQWRKRHPSKGGARGRSAARGRRSSHPPAPSSVGAVLDWRPLEWAQVGLLLLWVVVRG